MSIILITGATDGIGLAMARQYAAQNHQLILLGRRSLTDLTDPIFQTHHYIQQELAAEDCGERVATQLSEQGIGQIDLLIHNAGAGYYGTMASQTAVNIDNILAVNLLAPIRITHHLLPLLPSGAGQIVFVSSVATAVPTPDYAVYGASKAALEGFARSLRVELQGKIRVQTLRPGATRTKMHAKIGIAKEEMDWDKFPSAAAVAAQMIQAIERKRASATIGLNNKALRIAGRNGRFLIDPALKKKSDMLFPAATGKTATPTVAITGAADGIGKALAQEFGQNGWRVIGIDVDANRARATAQEMGCKFIIADLMTDAGIAHTLAELKQYAPLNLFIHNAGISAVGRFGTLDLAAQEAVLRLNLRAPLLLTTGLWQNERLAADATLVFVSSLSFYASYPGAAVYAASKDGLAHYSRTINAAWRSGRTLTLFPGPTRTVHARRYSPDNSREAKRMEPETVATAVYKAIQSNKTTLIPGFGNRAMATIGHWFPSLLEFGMKKALLEKMDNSR